MDKEAIEVKSPLYHACGASLYKILPETSADQVWVSGVTLLEHLEGISRSIAGSSVFRFVNTIPERNLLTNLNVGDRVYVTDASGDPAINQAVPASYIWMPTHEWQQIGQAAPPDMKDYVDGEGGIAVGASGKMSVALAAGEGIAVEGARIANLAPMFNAEEWITASGEWTAKATGWHEVLLIGGGGGSFCDITSWGGFGGNAGRRFSFLRHCQKGQKIPVTIGAGGIGGATNNAALNGGDTVFDGISSNQHGKAGGEFWVMTQYQYKTDNYFELHGNGPNCQRTYGTSVSTPVGHVSTCDGIFPGGGACGTITRNGGANYYWHGNGAAGAIRIRYFDPDKASGPEEA